MLRRAQPGGPVTSPSNDVRQACRRGELGARHCWMRDARTTWSGIERLRQLAGVDVTHMIVNSRDPVPVRDGSS